MPHLNGQRTAPACLHRRHRGLPDDEAVNRHGMLGEPDRGDPKTQLARDRQARAVEQSPHVRHRDPSRRARMVRHQVSQHQQAAEQLGASIACHEAEVVVGVKPGLGRETLGRCQAPAVAPDADRHVVAGAISGISQHPRGGAENFARPCRGGDNRRRRARDEFRPQQACLGVVLVPDLLRRGTGQHSENVIPGDAAWTAELTQALLPPQDHSWMNRPTCPRTSATVSNRPRRRSPAARERSGAAPERGAPG
jgi:hypothetical protein